MKPEDRDLAFLWDMRDFAREAHRLVRRVSFEQLDKDPMRKRALERTLELVGETARRVGESVQRANPDIDWRGLIGQRNVIAHDYGEIDHRRLHESARDRLPRLIAILDRILGMPGTP